MDEDDLPLLLTPGPLTTADETRAAMARDWGSRDDEFIALTAAVRSKLMAIVNAGNRSGYSCVLLQGSGTFVIEATLQSVVPAGSAIMLIENGAYGYRAREICERLGYRVVSHQTAEDICPDPDEISRQLKADESILFVFVVHCETTSGILNPVERIAEVVNGLGRHLIVDSMSSFGAIPFDVESIRPAAVVASSNKCLEGVPGLGFAIIKESVLETCRGNATSLSLDLHEQWQYLEKTGQWRFTPPTHVLAALDKALDLLEAEGGPSARLARYRSNCEALVRGMELLGVKTYLSDDQQAPIIVTFEEPASPAYDFENFYELLRQKGFAIYPGKLTQCNSFRIGCIGQVFLSDIERLVVAVGEVFDEMGISSSLR